MIPFCLVDSQHIPLFPVGLTAIPAGLCPTDTVAATVFVDVLIIDIVSKGIVQL